MDCQSKKMDRAQPCSHQPFFSGNKMQTIIGWDKREDWSQFHQHFGRSFFVRKFRAQLFCTYILCLYLFGARILAQKLLLKCWWNWHPEGGGPILFFNQIILSNKILFHTDEWRNRADPIKEFLSWNGLNWSKILWFYDCKI